MYIDIEDLGSISVNSIGKSFPFYPQTVPLILSSEETVMLMNNWT